MFYVSVFPLNSQNSILDFPNNNNKNYTKQVSNEFAERRSKKVAKLHFACQIRGPHCLYSKTCFTMRTRNPKTWIHLMFLDFQVRHYVSIRILFFFSKRENKFIISRLFYYRSRRKVFSARVNLELVIWKISGKYSNVRIEVSQNWLQVSSQV